MRRRNGQFKNCENCNKPIYISPGRLKNKSHTCSKKCHGIIASKLRSNKIKTNCSFCNKEIFFKQSAYKKQKYHTCSYKCRYSLMKSIYTGANNPKSLKLSEEDKWFYERTNDYIRRDAAKGNKSNLDYIFLKDLFYKQNKLCYYSGIEMRLYSNKNRENSAASYNVASLDRIDSKKGYSKDNVVWTINCINMFKAHHDFKDIKEVMKSIMIKEREDIKTKVKLLYPDSKMPITNNVFNAGYDIFVHRFEEFEDYIKVYSGIAIEPIGNFYYILAPRSSIYKSGLIMHNSLGIIDMNYTGELIGIFYKTESFNEVKIGDRLMQLIPQEFIKVDFIEVDSLTQTERGSGGFGSSGR